MAIWSRDRAVTPGASYPAGESGLARALRVLGWAAAVGVVAGLLIQHARTGSWGPARHHRQRSEWLRADARPDASGGYMVDGRDVQGDRDDESGVRLLRSPFSIASLSTTVGPYVVGVRQIKFVGYGYGLFKNPAADGSVTPNAPLQISLQVMSASASALDRVESFVENLRVVDNAGHAQRASESLQQTSFPNGRAELVRLGVPDPKAEYLRTIEGDIRLCNANGSATRLHFQIGPAPLPTRRHMFGVAAATLLSSAQTSALGVGASAAEPVVVRGERLARLAELFPPYSPDPDPFRLPTRLFPLDGVATSFPTPIELPNSSAVKGALDCSLDVKAERGGEFDGVLEIRAGKTRRTNVRIWDNDPVLVVLPPTAERSERVGLWMRVSLEMPPMTLPSSSPVSPFPPDKGFRGGSIHGQALAGDEPFGLAYVRLAIQRKTGARNGHHTTSVLELPLDEHGSWEIPNLDEGIYAVRMSKLIVCAPPSVGTIDTPAYLERKFGIHNAIWNGAEQMVMVRAGGETKLAAMRAVAGEPARRTRLTCAP